MKITKIILNQPFHEINLKDSFFDSLRNSYSEFNEWFKKKAEEGRKANYVFYSDDKIIAFLSLKIEDKNTSYIYDIDGFKQGIEHLKISTFKIASNSERRLGERFIQYIYKFARKRNIKFIYLTLFKNKSTSPLICLLSSYGFKKHEKTNKRGEEIWVKVLNFNHNNSQKENYPLNLCGLQNDRKIFWLSIESIYHNKLIGFDAESKKLDKKFDDRASVYTIEKYYITNCNENKLKNLHSGDILLIYRMGEKRSIYKVTHRLWQVMGYLKVMTSYEVWQKMNFLIKLRIGLLILFKN